MQEFWEERYRSDEYVYGKEPNGYLASKQNLIKKCKNALAIADGEGRNGAWLAKQGLIVTSVDGAASGLKKASALARSYNKTIETIRADLTTWQWPVEKYDLAVAIFVHFPESLRAQMHHKMIDAIKTDGIILLQAFSISQINNHSGGPRNLSMLFTKEAIETDFREIKTIELEEKEIVLDEGTFHQGIASVINYLGRKI